MHRRLLFALLFLLAVPAKAAEVGYTTGFREGAGGFFIASPSQDFHLNFMGYGQFLGSILSSDYDGANGRPDKPVGMEIRRARLSLLAALQRNYEFYLELGTPTLRNIVAAGGADFGLVEAHASAKIHEEYLQVRVGKFTTPFSRENSRSPKNLEFVERSTVLNSLHASSALDTQMGFMVFGRTDEGVFNYFISFVNGNGNSLLASRDNDGAKEFQLKLAFQPTRSLSLGIGYDTDEMSAQNVALVDHAFAPYVAGAVSGRRHGFEFDLDYQWQWFTLRTEFLYFTFADGAAAGRLKYLMGSHLTFGFMAIGDTNRGFQLLPRLEWASAHVSPESRNLFSIIFGAVAYFSPYVSNRVNYIAELPTHGGGVGAYATSGVNHIFLNEFQLKF